MSCAEDAGKTENSARANGHRDGIGKTQGAIEELQSAPERYGLGPRVSMQADGTNLAASNRPDTRKRLTRRLELDKENISVAEGRPHECPAHKV